jgi:hypothetical protein
MFTLLPGALTDDITKTGSVDYNKLKVSIVDLTDDSEDEVMRWPLQGCGDGIYNASDAFEDCDKNAAPPRNNVKYPHE